MDVKQKIEHLKYCIDRFDHYYEGINNKASFFLGLNTFILGGLLAGYFSVNEVKNCGNWFQLNLIIVCALGALSIVMTLLTINPYLKSKNKSVIYYGAIATEKYDEYKDMLQQLDEITLYKDFSKQSHILAGGLQSKFRKLKIAGFLILFQVLLLIPFTIHLIITLNN